MSFNSNFTESPQSKAEQQRLYREKEGEGFADLQQAIREVTAGMVDPAKRHETLTAGIKSESSIVRMKSYADNSTESLIRRGERKHTGGQTHGAWPGGTTAIPYVPESSFGAPGNNFSSPQYPDQYYPGNAALPDMNYLRGYPGQGRGI
ncbi:hypothetical protein C8R48DRAFT_673237 [Suillus tomentosus]|nr:hypothetical protein C8R48DRAFT_673237 [Suillus tomentosus]